jgi:hypothetical protein
MTKKSEEEFCAYSITLRKYAKKPQEGFLHAVSQ